MKITNRSIVLILTGIGIFACFELFTSLYFVSAIGLVLTMMLMVKFIQDLGRRMEVRDLIALLALTQWVVGPVLAYNVLPYDELYYMAVDEITYMNYVVPASAALLLGLYFPFSDERVINLEDFNRLKIFMMDKKMLGYLLAGFGFLAGVASSFAPKSLSFAFFLLSGLEFVGVYMIMVTDSKLKWPALGLVLGLVTFQSVQMGMFGELMLWLMFSMLIVAFVIKIPTFAKISILLFGFTAVMFIQSTKEEYRMATWYSESDMSNSEIYKIILTHRLENPYLLFQTGALMNMGARLNQGWIIARVLNHVPENQPFVHGETVKKALYAGLLPRFLVPDKAVAGGRANFERFTGTELPETTSMDISLMGEGYANYGVSGGIIFLLIIGIFYNLILTGIISISKKYPTIIFWIPVLFFQVIKAETDLATVFNHFTKAAMLTFFVFWGATKVLKIKM
jgi:hypothetical protein